jgi:hypothetical protein
MVWVAMTGICLTGLGLVFEGAKGLKEPPSGKTRKTSKGTAYATLAVGVVVAIAGVVIPLVAF